MKSRYLLLLLLAGTFFLTVPGCKKETTAPVKEQVTGDLFPLTTGHKLTFTGYIRQAVADTNITATGAYYRGIMTVVPAPALPPIVAPLAGTTFFLSDSSLVSPPSTWVVSGFYLKRTTSTSGDFYFLTNAGRFYRQTGVARIDSLKWVKLVVENAFIGESWVAFDSTYTSASPAVGTARLKVDCVFQAKENVTVNSVTYAAFKLVATRSVFIGGSATPLTSGATATIWLVPNLGIVKFIFNSDGETSGFDRNLLSKNF